MQKKIITTLFISVYFKWFIDAKINFKRQKRLSLGKVIKSSKIIEFNDFGDQISDTIKIPVTLSSCVRKTPHPLKGKYRDNVNSGAGRVYQRHKRFDAPIPLHFL